MPRLRTDVSDLSCSWNIENWWENLDFFLMFTNLVCVASAWCCNSAAGRELVQRNNHWSQLRSVDRRNTDLGRFSVNRSGNHPESVRVDLRTDLSRFSTTQPSVVKTDLNSSGQCRATLSNVLLRRAAYIKTCRERWRLGCVNSRPRPADWAETELAHIRWDAELV